MKNSLGLYLDTHTLFCAAKRKNVHLNYEKILKFYKEQAPTKALAYVGIQSGAEKGQAFVCTLRETGYEVRLRELMPWDARNENNGEPFIGLNPGIAVDAMTDLLERNCRRFVLGTGCGDMEPLVTAIHLRGGTVELLGFPKIFSRRLVLVADSVREISDDWLIPQKKKSKAKPKVEVVEKTQDAGGFGILG